MIRNTRPVGKPQADKYPLQLKIPHAHNRAFRMRGIKDGITDPTSALIAAIEQYAPAELAEIRELEGSA